ncbi:hypothetical protein M0D21_13235 [Aquimarina sp. D1M17]|uniref:hypothetical protein n=1 Tax=Aquimarina acroporae TaxID=2937283 RepID=UPI0020BE1F80|nr:hypothetical protein [Aquimarina acroporae]MCK8522541.1 hypothetical protein [Aquimarina acroporae]
MANYIKYSNTELLQVLYNYNSLTFIAKIELKKELLKRNLGLNTPYFIGLNDQIIKEMEEVKELKFLTDIGFNVSWFNENKSFEITRSIKATIGDFIAIFVGLIFFIIGVYGLSGTFNYFYSDIQKNLLILILNGLLLVIGFFGFKVLFNGLNRFIEYKDFKFVLNKNQVIIRKRLDFKLQQFERDANSLNININEDQISLMSGDIGIIRTFSPSYRAKLSLEEIASYAQ